MRNAECGLLIYRKRIEGLGLRSLVLPTFDCVYLGDATAPVADAVIMTCEPEPISMPSRF